jgi:hypothetical protein
VHGDGGLHDRLAGHLLAGVLMIVDAIILVTAALLIATSVYFFWRAFGD